MLTDYDEGKRLASIALKRLRREDIIHRGFLRPLEIALKANPAESSHPHTTAFPAGLESFLPDDETQGFSQPNSLPCGLRIAVKHSICDNRFALKDVLAVDSSVSFETLK